VDAIAHDLLGIENDDPRRLRAAVEEAIYAELDKGHTLCVSATLKRAVTKLLSSPELAARALALARDNNSIVVHEGRYQSAGAWIMERAVAEFVSAGIHQPRQSPLFGGDPDELIDRFEQEEAAVLGVAGFRLNVAQRTAIKRSFAHGFSVITGGAGTGKTTALNALYALLDTTGLPRFQMALSGRAAKRMREATGERAYTIAGFLKNVSTEAMGPAPILILDEASMVDLATMYRLIRRLPAQCRMVLVGDPYQLPPIGSGLVLHCLTRLDAVPVSELTEVKRQSADSAIPAFAKAIRNGVWPEAPSSDITADVAVVPCEDTQLIDAALALYEIDRENTQILCATRANPYSGFRTISGARCYRYTAGEGAAPLRAFGQATGFYEGDLLLYTRNDWDRNLQNGLLGRLVEAFPEPRRVNVTEGDVEAIGWVEWEGRRTPLLESDVEWLEHGYAISIHKSQGSQFKRVIVPITRGRLLDRTLVYTAVTRAQHQVILVGDIAAIRQAVTAPPAAHLRRIALSTMLERALHQVGGLAARQTQPQ
jgi:exodeoxyribonuclease V alpha subunit